MPRSIKVPAKPVGRIRTPCERCPLRQLDTFRKFTGPELEFMRSFKTGELRLGAGTTILSEGTNSPYLYTVLEGWAFKHKTLQDGRRQVLNYAMPGDLLGLQASVFDVMTHTVEALTDVVLCVFPRDRLWSLFEHHTGLAFDVTWLASQEESILGEFLVSVGQRSASERVAFVLLSLYRRALQSGLVEAESTRLPLTQELLADTIGFSLVHTNKTLKRLRKSNSFTWSGTHLQMHDEEHLATLVGSGPRLASKRPFL